MEESRNGDSGGRGKLNKAVGLILREVPRAERAGARAGRRKGGARSQVDPDEHDQSHERLWSARRCGASELAHRGAAVAVESELVRVVARELRAVCHDEGGRLARGEEGEEALLEAGLAGGGWLIGDDQRRRGGGAAREVEARGGEALPLAAGEGAAEVWPRLVELGAACGEPLEPRPRQSLEKHGVSGGRGVSQRRGVQELRPQTASREDVRPLRQRDDPVGRRRRHLARACRPHAERHPQQRRLSAAVWPRDEDVGSLRDGSGEGAGEGGLGERWRGDDDGPELERHPCPRHPGVRRASLDEGTLEQRRGRTLAALVGGAVAVCSLGVRRLERDEEGEDAAGVRRGGGCSLVREDEVLASHPNVDKEVERGEKILGRVGSARGGAHDGGQHRGEGGEDAEVAQHVPVQRVRAEALQLQLRGAPGGGGERSVQRLRLGCAAPHEGNLLGVLDEVRVQREQLRLCVCHARRHRRDRGARESGPAAGGEEEGVAVAERAGAHHEGQLDGEERDLDQRLREGLVQLDGGRAKLRRVCQAHADCAAARRVGAALRRCRERAWQPARRRPLRSGHERRVGARRAQLVHDCLQQPLAQAERRTLARELLEGGGGGRRQRPERVGQLPAEELLPLPLCEQRAEQPDLGRHLDRHCEPHAQAEREDAEPRGRTAPIRRHGETQHGAERAGCLWRPGRRWRRDECAVLLRWRLERMARLELEPEEDGATGHADKGDGPPGEEHTAAWLVHPGAKEPAEDRALDLGSHR
mmetsp:Transcript_15058/g.48117  ORF Transcript_15058/g.48117 Transcript_15058/m.48117 type:complete len:760 (+) Transcript_15058:128-2407(+)